MGTPGTGGEAEKKATAGERTGGSGMEKVGQRRAGGEGRSGVGATGGGSGGGRSQMGGRADAVLGAGRPAASLSRAPTARTGARGRLGSNGNTCSCHGQETWPEEKKRGTTCTDWEYFREDFVRRNYGRSRSSTPSLCRSRTSLLPSVVFPSPAITPPPLRRSPPFSPPPIVVRLSSTVIPPLQVVISSCLSPGGARDSGKGRGGDAGPCCPSRLFAAKQPLVAELRDSGSMREKEEEKIENCDWGTRAPMPTAPPVQQTRAHPRSGRPNPLHHQHPLSTTAAGLATAPPRAGPATSCHPAWPPHPAPTRARGGARRAPPSRASCPAPPGTAAASRCSQRHPRRRRRQRKRATAAAALGGGGAPPPGRPSSPRRRVPRARTGTGGPPTTAPTRATGGATGATATATPTAGPAARCRPWRPRPPATPTRASASPAPRRAAPPPHPQPAGAAAPAPARPHRRQRHASGEPRSPMAPGGRRAAAASPGPPQRPPASTRTATGGRWGRRGERVRAAPAGAGTRGQTTIRAAGGGGCRRRGKWGWQTRAPPQHLPTVELGGQQGLGLPRGQPPRGKGGEDAPLSGSPW